MSRKSEYYYVVTEQDDTSHTVEGAEHIEVRPDVIMFWDDKGGLIKTIHEWKDFHKLLYIERTVIGHTRDYGYDCVFNVKERQLTITLKTSGDVGEMAHVFRNYVERSPGGSECGKDIRALAQYLSKCHKRMLA